MNTNDLLKWLDHNIAEQEHYERQTEHGADYVQFAKNSKHLYQGVKRFIIDNGAAPRTLSEIFAGADATVASITARVVATRTDKTA